MIKRIALLSLMAFVFGAMQVFFSSIEWLQYVNVYMILIAVLYFRSLWRGDVYALLFIASIGHALLQGHNVSTYALPLFVILLLLGIWKTIYQSHETVVNNFVLILGLLGYALLHTWIIGSASASALTKINFGPVIITALVTLVIGHILSKIIFYVRTEYELKV